MLALDMKNVVNIRPKHIKVMQFSVEIALYRLYLAAEESWNLYNVSNSSNSFTLSLE
jgi:hypothetical protein